MAGIRLRHNEWHNCRVAITHPTLKLKKDAITGKYKPCMACGGVPHERKTIHLDFNTEGEAFVSPEVLEMLKEAGLWRFDLEIVNEVDNPPDQIVRLAGPPTVVTSTKLDHRGLIPPLTKWLNRRRTAPKDRYDYGSIEY